MTQIILLSKNSSCLVDDDDYDRLSENKWYCNNAGYAARHMRQGKYKYTMLLMHRFILGLEKGDGICVDHANLNRLDNRKCNLRICTSGENQSNKGIQSNNTSGVKGVRWSEPCKKWHAQISFNGKNRNLGFFKTIDQAAEAYSKEAKKLFGQFHRISND